MADPNEQRGNRKLTAIMAAASAGYNSVLKELLALPGANVRATGKNDKTALMYAAVGGRVEAISILLEAGADVNAADGYGWTALMDASNWGQVDAVRVLLDFPGINATARDKGGKDARAIAEKQGKSHVVELLDDFLNAPCSVEVLISGGQTGADSVPFGIAAALGLRIKGFMPKGFKRSDGKGEEIARRHGLREGTGGFGWKDRKNAESADACIAFLCTKVGCWLGAGRRAPLWLPSVRPCVRSGAGDIASFWACLCCDGSPGACCRLA